MPLQRSEIRLKAEVHFTGMTGEVQFLYHMNDAWIPFGPIHRMQFALDHFAGCRFGLFLYAVKRTGGRAAFSDFIYRR